MRYTYSIFHKLSWYVLQFSMGLWQFVAIFVAIIFLLFYKIGMKPVSKFCCNCWSYFEFVCSQPNEFLSL